MSAARERAEEIILAQLDEHGRMLRAICDELRRKRVAPAKRAATVARRVEAAVTVVPDDMTRARARRHLQRRAAR